MEQQIKIIPLATIQAAICGEETAIVEIITLYKPYIKALATRELKDEFGNVFYYVDDSIVIRLETSLICAILKKFKILAG